MIKKNNEKFLVGNNYLSFLVRFCAFIFLFLKLNPKNKKVR